MKTRVAINGLGRIGRCVLKAYFEGAEKYSNIELVAVNGPADSKVHEYLLKYDSVHGRFPGTVEAKEDSLTVNGEKIELIKEKDITKLPWKKLQIDVVLECTGKFVTKDAMVKHIEGGAESVMLSAPAKGGSIKTFVLGVNHQDLKPEDKMISIGSCTTNCLAPIAKVLNDSFGIKKAHMTTIHSYTNDQRILDGSHKDLRRGRACAVSMIPTSTGAAKALSLVIPSLEGKIDGCAIRVPTPNVSLVDLTFYSEKKTSVQEVNDSMIRASQNELEDILFASDEGLVSVDFVHNPHSSIFDLSQTKVIGDNLVRVASWYDNEWGFSNRMLDIIKVWKQ